ncbi:tyrosine-type recombinase/integrase [Maricurvus nonylphenolicus]|uniref:tyrosine-type recombinase/integrase n=1 Tax=Maricurvus nonylphenolicus TaxID=1008307 RepID=UPI0036F204FD
MNETLSSVINEPMKDGSKGQSMQEIEPTSAVDLKRKQRGQLNVIKRDDYKPTAQIQQKTITTGKVSHDMKLAKYRDRLLGALDGRIEFELFQLLDKRSMEIQGAKSENTEISYYSDMIAYVEFCNREELVPLPYLDGTVEAYLIQLEALGRKRGTIDRHVASLASWAEMLELDDPRQSFRVKTRLQKLRRRLSKRTRQAEGLRVEHLELALDLFNPEVARDCQDITLLFIGFETLCRQSELVGFDWSHFELQADGSGLIDLEQSKTDQEGEGEWLHLSVTTTNLLLGWGAVSNPNYNEGAIFRGIYSDNQMGDRLSTRGVQRCFKRIARRLDLEPSIFSGHSTRVGAAQEMIERNIDSARIMLSGRWKTMAMLTRYSKKIRAKRSGMADLTKQLHWDDEPMLPSGAE